MMKKLIIILIITFCSKTNALDNGEQVELNQETLVQKVQESDTSYKKGYNVIVNDNAVRVRDQPSLEGAIVGQLNQGMTVTVFGRSQERMFWEGYDSYWLKIRKDTIDGWAYWAYINLLNTQYDLLPILSTYKPISMYRYKLFTKFICQ
jgi:hypothetical protein